MWIVQNLFGAISDRWRCHGRGLCTLTWIWPPTVFLGSHPTLWTGSKCVMVDYYVNFICHDFAILKTLDLRWTSHSRTPWGCSRRRWRTLAFPDWTLSRRWWRCWRRCRGRTGPSGTSWRRRLSICVQSSVTITKVQLLFKLVAFVSIVKWMWIYAPYYQNKLVIK